MALPDPTGLEPVVDLPLGPDQPSRLLDVARPIPGANSDGSPRWLQGLRWRPWPCRDLTVAQGGVVCDVDDLAADAEDLRTDDAQNGCDDFSHQMPFRIEDAIINNVIDDVPDGAMSRARLRARWERQVSAVFARELIDGAGSGGHSLSSDATEPESHPYGAAIGLQQALAHIEDEIARRLRGGAGYIFLPPGMFSQAIGFGTDLSGDVPRTPNGNFLVSDAGFVDAAAPDGESAAADGEAWIYASGPVFIERTDLQFFEALEMADDQVSFLNSFMDRGFAHGIILFDPCPVTAVLVSYG